MATFYAVDGPAGVSYRLQAGHSGGANHAGKPLPRPRKAPAWPGHYSIY